MAATKTKKKVAAPPVEVTLAKFDTTEPFNVVRDGVRIDQFTPLTRADYHPRGGTPLRDATASMIGHLDVRRKHNPEAVTIGVLIDESGSMGGNEQSVVSGVNEFVGGMAAVDSVDPEAGGKVLCVVVTDGEENSSKETTAEHLRNMTTEREADGWTFIYLGANQDAWSEGRAMGYSGTASGQTVGYASTPVGTASALRSVTNDGIGYISDNQAYLSRRKGTSQRTVTEQGDEVLDNLGAKTKASPPLPVGGPTQSSYGNVGDALKKAKESTGGDEK